MRLGGPQPGDHTRSLLYVCSPHARTRLLYQYSSSSQLVAVQESKSVEKPSPTAVSSGLKLRMCLARDPEPSLRLLFLLLLVQSCGAVEGKSVVLCCSVYRVPLLDCWATGCSFVCLLPEKVSLSSQRETV